MVWRQQAAFVYHGVHAHMLDNKRTRNDLNDEELCICMLLYLYCIWFFGYAATISHSNNTHNLSSFGAFTKLSFPAIVLNHHLRFVFVINLFGAFWHLLIVKLFLRT